jgi:Fuc2NAc and GlcNAc transferase
VKLTEQLDILLITFGTLALSFGLTVAVRKLALMRGMLDVPNHRSSHAVPTPRGGGVAIVVSANLALVVLVALHRIPWNVFLALCGGIAVAVVGFIDDRHPVRPSIRLSVHLGAAMWALACLGGLPQLQIGATTFPVGPWGYVFGALGIVWTLNLFNFMDGIDGIAASEATFVAWAGAVLWVVAIPGSSTPAVACVLGAACCGFLLLNWPPAAIFMGDVGSGYVGYALAVLALSAGRESSGWLSVWLILGGVFFIDATVTLVRRSLRGERLYEAHRSHAYQHLSRRWRGHLPVTKAVILIDLLWLLPCAALATFQPRYGAWVLLAALVPLVVVVCAAGAGQPERAAG